MHLVTPHVHHSDSVTSVSSEDIHDSSMMDWFVDFFDHDLGEGHLETFEKGNSSRDYLSFDELTSLSIPLFYLTPLVSRLITTDVQKHWMTAPQAFNLPPKAYLQPKTGLRAPPAELI